MSIADGGARGQQLIRRPQLPRDEKAPTRTFTNQRCVGVGRQVRSANLCEAFFCQCFVDAGGDIRVQALCEV